MAGIEAGFINVLIAPKLVSDFAGKLGLDVNKAAGDVGDQAGKTLGQRLSDSFNKTGKTLTKNITAPIAAGFGIAIKAGLDLDAAFDDIRTKTGQTGEAFESLQQSFRNVASGSAASFEDISGTISTLNSRLGLTGKPLENLSTQLLNLQQITGQGVDIDTVTELFNSFGISADKQAETLDKLFVVSQKTGVGFNELAKTTLNSVAQFQTLGFSAVEAAAFVGQLEKSGANTGQVLAGLNRSILKSVSGNDEAEKATQDLAKAQTTLQEKIAQLQVAELKLDEIRSNPKSKPSDILAQQNAVQELKNEINTATLEIDNNNKIIAQSTGGIALSTKDFFQGTIDQINSLIQAGDEAGAQTLAKDVFGKNFTTVIKQIKDGTFNIQEFTNEVLKSSESINKVKEETSDFDVTIKELKNSATVALEPIANILLPAINSAFLAAKPVLEDFSNSFRNLSPETQKFILIFAGAAAAIGPALLIFAKIITSVQAIIGVFKLLNLTLLASPWTLIAIAAVAAVVLIIQNWDSIKEYFSNLWEGLKLIFSTSIEFWQGKLEEFVNYFKNIWENLKTIFSSTIDFYKNKWGEFTQFIDSKIEQAGAFVKRTFESIKTVFSNVAGSIKTTASTIGSIITKPFEIAYDRVSFIFNFLKTGVANLATTIINIFKGLGTGIANAVASIINAPGIRQITSIVSGIGNIFGGAFGGKRAMGGPVSANKAYLVGEKGPEIVVPQSNGFVLPNNLLSNISSGRNGMNYTINIYNPKSETSSASIPAALRSANILRSN